MIQTKILNKINEIKQDRVHGAVELAVMAVETLRLAVEECQARNSTEFISAVKQICIQFEQARPSMASIKNALDRVTKEIYFQQESELGFLQKLVIENANKFIADIAEEFKTLTDYTASLISENDIILVHSYSSTVIKVLNMLNLKKRIKVFVTRAGTVHAGRRVVRDMDRQKYDIVYIDDTAVGVYVNQVDKVFVGADRVCVDGTLVNGAGTLLIALVAQKASVPMYVICDSLKFDPYMTSDQVVLEEKDAAEMAIPEAESVKIEMRNPYFDKTPEELITAYVTEEGILRSEGLKAYFKKLTG